MLTGIAARLRRICIVPGEIRKAGTSRDKPLRA